MKLLAIHNNFEKWLNMQIYKFKHESCGKNGEKLNWKAVGPLLKALFEVCCEIITELWNSVAIINEH